MRMTAAAGARRDVLLVEKLDGPVGDLCLADWGRPVVARRPACRAACGQDTEPGRDADRHRPCPAREKDHRQEGHCESDCGEG